MDADDFAPNLLYRSAYGVAANLAEARRFEGGSGRTFARKAEPIMAEVLRQLGAGADADPETVQEAVGDALAGRRPRW